MSVINSANTRVQARDSKGEPIANVWERSGKYEVQWTDSNRKTRFKMCPASVRTPKQAKAFREKLLVDDREGRSVAPSARTVASLWKEFEADFEGQVLSGERSRRTLELYRQRWSTHLEPKLGSVKAQALRKTDVSSLVADLRRQGKSPWTIKGIYGLLGSIVDFALEHDLIAVSPMLSKKRQPKGKPKSEPRTLTDQECERLVAGAPEGWRAMMETAVWTGLRLSELLGLTWADVDLKDETIRVRKQLSRGSNEHPARRVELKTDAARREVYFDDTPATAVLKQHRETRLELGHARPESYVFGTKDGKPLGQRNATRAIYTAGDSAKLNPEKDEDGRYQGEPVGWHDLRHTAISRWIHHGLTVKEVQAMAGHSSAAFTLSVYGHLFDDGKSTKQKIKQARSTT